MEENVIIPSRLEWHSGKVKGFSGKKLIEQKNGGLKLIKVDPLAEYPEHVHPDKTEFVYVLEGNPSITIGDEKYSGNKGAFFILPQSVKHSIVNPEEEECRLLVGAIKE